jgi:hypothetical protein
VLGADFSFPRTANALEAAAVVVTGEKWNSHMTSESGLYQSGGRASEASRNSESA